MNLDRLLLLVVLAGLLLVAFREEPPTELRIHKLTLVNEAGRPTATLTATGLHFLGEDGQPVAIFGEGGLMLLKGTRVLGGMEAGDNSAVLFLNGPTPEDQIVFRPGD